MTHLHQFGLGVNESFLLELEKKMLQKYPVNSHSLEELFNIVLFILAH